MKRSGRNICNLPNRCVCFWRKWKINKREYLAQLERELKRNHVPDAGEILNEYAQHFAFKLADGYSEEEISARLGEPALLALAIFALCGALGMALSMFYAGAIEFWHAWGWFGYSA